MKKKLKINIPCNDKCWGDITLKIYGRKVVKKKLCLRIKFLEQYPSKPPNMHIYYKNYDDFSNEDLKYLKNAIDQKAQALSESNEPMIFQIALFLEEEHKKLTDIINFYENWAKEEAEQRKSRKKS